MFDRSSYQDRKKNIVFRYWRAYGGVSSLAKSWYLYSALLLTGVLRNSWLEAAPSSSSNWWDTALGVLPNLLGFSLGGYLMWLGVGDASFRAWLHRRSNIRGTSVYMEVSATFVHFVVVQIVALVIAAIAKHSQFPLSSDEDLCALALFFGLTPEIIFKYLAPVGYGVGFFFFLYALLTALEAAFGVFRVSSWQDIHADSQPNADKRTVTYPCQVRWRGRRSLK